MPRQKTILNISAAGIGKEGSAPDLPIALGKAAFSGQVGNITWRNIIIMGEFSLDGRCQPIYGAMLVVIQARKEDFIKVCGLTW